MTTQEQADEQGRIIAEIGSAADKAMMDDSFGQVAYREFCEQADHLPFQSGVKMPLWTSLTLEVQLAWIAIAAAVRKAEQDLVKGAKP